jgi:hypothetical protein
MRRAHPGSAFGIGALILAVATASPAVARAQEARDSATSTDSRDANLARARTLAHANHTDDAIAAYEQWLARSPDDAEAWRELAAQRRRAGRYDEEIAALKRASSLDETPATRRIVEKNIARARSSGRGTIEPRLSGSRDSDGLTTSGAGLTVTSPLLGRARLSAMTAAGSAGDGASSRTSHDVMLGVEYRPLAQLRLQFNGGVVRADRSFIDTMVTPTPTPPSGPGRGGSGSLPIGRPPTVGVNNIESFPVGNARLVWRKPGDALAVDVRVGRQLLDASPYLVAQGVLRDEASLSLDLRLAGPMRVRGFGKLGRVHNADESNGRQIFGGALAYVPGAYEISLRAQTMRYDTATALAYFSPRRVQTAELGTYFERETDRGITIAMDLGAGAQQVAEWSSVSPGWSPAFHAWTQVVVPLNGTFALGTEIEAYDSRVGSDARAPTVGAARWRYASGIVSLRVRF